MLDGFLTALLVLFTPCDHPSVPTTYDLQIRIAVSSYWEPKDRLYWCQYKAQLWEESRFQPHVESLAGAQGIAQIMPTTRQEIAASAFPRDSVSPWDANASIAMGAWYMRWLGDGFTEPRSGLCRLRLQQAAYNAGKRSIYRSQAMARRQGYLGLCWNDGIRESLPMVTGRHSVETCRYVWSIARTTALLQGASFREPFADTCARN